MKFKMEKFKKIIAVLIVIAVLAALVAVVANITLSKVDNKANPIVTMEIEGYGQVKIKLYPDMAPNTVKNFIRLAKRGYYKGKTFNSIQEGLVTGGGEKTTGAKLSNIKDLAEGEDDKTYAIKGEFAQAGYEKNTLSHERGVISMSRTTSSDYQDDIYTMQLMGYGSYLDTILDEMYDSQSAAFFILTEDDADYNGIYTAFGKVEEGMDIIDKISKLEVEKTTAEDGSETATTKIVNQPVISNVSVDTFGVDYGEPETCNLEDFEAVMNVFMQSIMQQQQSGGVTTEQ